MHLWLSRALANKAHFPAIDVLQSISRVRGDVTDKEHVANAKKVLRLLALYAEIIGRRHQTAAESELR